MSVTTAQDIIKKALQKIGVLSAGETMTNDMANDGLDSLNVMIDSWSSSSLNTLALIRESFSLVVDQRTYTIGSGGNFDTTKPFSIKTAFVRDSGNIDYPVQIVKEPIYNSISDKSSTTSNRPSVLYYDAGATQQATQLGTVYLHPIPSDTETLFIFSEKPFTEFASLTASVTFPPSYKRALIYNLAIELTEYGVSISPAIAKIAEESLRVIRIVNSSNKMQAVVHHFPSGVGRADIRAGF